MGGVCFAEADDEMRYRHPQRPGMHPHGHPGAHGHPGMRGGPRPPPNHGPPPTHGRVGPYPGNRFEEEDFMHQKFRPDGFNPTPGMRQHGHPDERQMHGHPDERQMHGHPDERQMHGHPDERQMHGHPDERQMHGHPDERQMHGHPDERQMHGHAGEPPQRGGSRGFGRDFHDNRGFDDNRYDPDDDDHLGNGGSVGGCHLSPPRKMTQSSMQSSRDGYDDSQEKRQMGPIYPYGQDSPQMAQSPPGERRKSLSDRLNKWSERNRSSRLDSSNDPMSMTYDPARTSDRDAHSDDYPNFPERANRKKSLQERVAEFKERRKNSQVRFDDESYSEAMDRHEQHRDFYGILDREAEEREMNEDLQSDHSYEVRDSRGVPSHGHERQRSDRESHGHERQRSDRESHGHERKKSDREGKRKSSKKRKKSTNSEKSDRKRKSKRKGSKSSSREEKDKKKRTRKNSDRKKDRKHKRSKEERGAESDRPRKRSEHSERKRTEERSEFPPSGGPHRLSQENIELFTRRLSHRSGEREFDTQSYQPPLSKRKTSDRSALSYRSAPEMDRMRQYQYHNEDRRDFAIHE